MSSKSVLFFKQDKGFWYQQLVPESLEQSGNARFYHENSVFQLVPTGVKPGTSFLLCF